MRVVGVVWAFFLLTGTLFAQLDAPRIKINPLGHTGKVSNLTFTPDGKNIITVSEDKTVRVWDVNSGESLAMYSFQIGEGPQGMIYTSALSPDGNLLAFGGYPVEQFGSPYSILFDLSSGKQLGLLEGHSNIITSMDFSGDARYLATGSADGSVILWDLEDISNPKIALTLEHEFPVVSLSFNPVNMKLVVGTDDKDLYLYDLANLSKGTRKFSPRKLSRHKASVKRVKFSPDGRYLASSSYKDVSVMLWDANGNFIREVHKEGNSVNTMTFSHDGTILVVMEDVKGVGESYSIPNGNRLSRFIMHDNSVFSSDFNPRSISGNYLVASAGGNNNVIYIWNAINGRVQKTIKGQGSMVWDLAFGEGNNLFISNKFLGDQPDHNFQYAFNFSSFKLTREFNYEDYANLKSEKPRIRQINHYTLQLKKGKFLEVSQDQDGRILDYLETDNGDVIVACDFALKIYDESGRLRRDLIGHEGAVRSVTISADGRYLASGGQDQTIKLWLLEESGKFPSIRQVITDPNWIEYFEEFEVDSLTYREDQEAWKKFMAIMEENRDKNLEVVESYFYSIAEQIKPFLTLFVADDGEWICWAPSGYFSSSPNGSSYFGWHVNKGYEEKAVFYSADQFFDILYRPEDLPRSIEQGRRIVDILRDEGERIFDLSKLHKPSAAFFNTNTLAVGKSRLLDYERGHYNSEEKKINLTIDYYDGGGGVKSIVIRQNGKTITADENLKEGRTNERMTVSYEVELMNGNNVFEVYANNYQNIESTPDVIEIKYIGEIVPTSNLYILAVGIDTYKNSSYNLNYASYDAKMATEKLTENADKIFNSVEKLTFYNEQATKENIMQGFDVVKQKAKPEDVFVFYYAGHGVLQETDNGEEYFLIPTDVTQMYGDLDQLEEKAISFGAEMRAELAGIKPQKQLVLLDACQSGAAAESLIKTRAAASEEKAIVQLARSVGSVIIAASGTQQYAAEVETLKHGVFTYTLLEALSGSADVGKDQRITVTELANYMKDKVPEMSEKYVGKSQYPKYWIRGEDFPIGYLKD